MATTVPVENLVPLPACPLGGIGSVVCPPSVESSPRPALAGMDDPLPCLFLVTLELEANVRLAEGDGRGSSMAPCEMGVSPMVCVWSSDSGCGCSCSKMFS